MALRSGSQTYIFHTDVKLFAYIIKTLRSGSQTYNFHTDVKLFAYIIKTD